MDKREQDFEREMALSGMREVVERAQAILHGAAEEIGHYLSRFEDSVNGVGGSHSSPSEVASWMINHCTSNILGNLRIDLMATYGARADRAAK